MQKISLVESLINNKDPIATKSALINYLHKNSIDSWSDLNKANFYTLIAKYSRFSSSYSEALEYFELAKKFFDRTGNNETNSYLGDYYYYFSSLEIDLGNLEKAKNLGLLCFDFYNKQNNKDGISKANDLLGQINLKYLNFDEAISYANKSIEIAEKTTAELTVYYNNLGEIYRIKGDLSVALECYEKAFNDAKKNDNIYNMAIIHNNFGLIYSELGQYDIALVHFKNSYNYFKQLDIFDFECTNDYTTCLISSYSVTEDNKDDTLSTIENLLHELHKHIHDTKSNNYLLSFITLLGQFEMKRNNFFTAEQNFCMSILVSDFIDNPILKIIIRVHFINWALRAYNIEHQTYYLDRARRYLEEAKVISYRTLKSTLLAELKVLEAVLIAINDKPEANFILGEIMSFARHLNNLRLMAKVESEKERIREKNTSHKKHADILQYINSIARLTNIQQRD